VEVADPKESKAANNTQNQKKNSYQRTKPLTIRTQGSVNDIVHTNIICHPATHKGGFSWSAGLTHQKQAIGKHCTGI